MTSSCVGGRSGGPDGTWRVKRRCNTSKVNSGAVLLECFRIERLRDCLATCRWNAMQDQSHTGAWVCETRAPAEIPKTDFL